MVLGALVLLALTAAYAFGVAPYRVALTTHRVPMAVQSPLRLFQISDLHTKGFGDREQLVLELSQVTRPDLIVITGDSVTSGAPCESARATLDRLHAPLGVWSVPGNWEYWMAERQGAHCLCPSSSVRCLENEAVRIQDDLWLVGIDDILAGTPKAADTLARVPADAQVILLSHEPTVMTVTRRAALILAGHTHGGQICLPFVGAVLLPPESGSDVSGWYQEGQQRMYVSRGVGTSVVPARLICGPEVSLFEIVPSAAGR